MSTVGMGNSGMTKAEIRALVRANFAPPAAGDAVALIRQLRTLAPWRNARSVCVYIALPDEAPTAAIFADCFASGLAVSIPKVCGDKLLLRRVTDLDQCRPGAFGILEPPDDAPLWYPADMDCFIVPGVAFDRNGGRVGRGKGYYDRLLADVPYIPRIALAYDRQLFDTVPREPHDLRMSWIITPTQIHKCPIHPPM